MRIALTLVRIARRGLDLALVALIALVVSSLLIARVVPMLTAAPVLVVGGASMEPSIHLGSVAIDQPVTAADLAVGDVVSLKVGPKQVIFTHRITRLVPRDDGLWIETKGDNNATIDPSIVPATDVIGRVQVVIPLLGFVVQVLSTPSGLALTFMAGAVLLGLAFALELAEEELTDTEPTLRPVRVHSLRRVRPAEPGATG